MPSAGAVGACPGGRPLTPDTAATVPTPPLSAPAPAPRPEGRAAPDGSEGLLAAVIASLEDDKAEEIVPIDLRGRSEMGDFMVIASGRSSRQVAAISEHLADRLKQQHGVPSRTEGRETGDWVLIDAGDVIVHVFRPEVRDFYQLEKMWLPPSAQTGTGAPRREAEGTA